jgi:hypothetical protein
MTFVCGPAKGTKAKPYRCICCKQAYADPDALAVSICWGCMSGNTSCKACRQGGIFVSDFRVGGYEGTGDNFHFEAHGGLGHRLARLTGKTGIMTCGVRIPREFFGGGIAVVPPCPECWKEEA